MRFPFERRPLAGLQRGAPGPPDFIGVGAHGSGSGWWHAMLLRHPDIRPPRARRRALHFFTEFCARPLEDADVARYHRCFPRRAGTITGEWTGRYLPDPWTPPLLQRAAPDAKLLVLLSDPIERYRVVFTDRRADARADGRPFFMADAVERRCYASQLGRLHRFFDPERILVLQYERCRRDPLAQYKRTLRFLGVRDDVAPRRLRRKAAGKPEHAHVELALRLGLPEGTRGRVQEKLTGRPAGRELAPLWPDLEAALHTALDPEVEALAALVPELDLALWPNFAHLARPAPVAA